MGDHMNKIICIGLALAALATSATANPMKERDARIARELEACRSSSTARINPNSHRAVVLGCWGQPARTVTSRSSSGLVVELLYYPRGVVTIVDNYVEDVTEMTR